MRLFVALVVLTALQHVFADREVSGFPSLRANQLGRVLLLPSETANIPNRSDWDVPTDTALESQNRRSPQHSHHPRLAYACCTRPCSSCITHFPLSLSCL